MPGPRPTERLYSAIFGALTKLGDPAEVQRQLASTARALASFLPMRSNHWDPDSFGPEPSHEEFLAAATDARDFLEAVADLLGGPDDPDWMGDDFAYSVALKKRRDWKPPREMLPGQGKRLAAAKRVYDLMAQDCFSNARNPKQEAAVAAAMLEFGLVRSKVMRGLKEYRMRALDLVSFATGRFDIMPLRERRAKAHWFLVRRAIEREWFRRNPDAHFLGVPAGSALEKELLSRKSPRDPHE